MGNLIQFAEVKCQAFENAAVAVIDRVIQALPKKGESLLDKIDQFLFNRSSRYRAYIIRSFVRNSKRYEYEVSIQMYLQELRSNDNDSYGRQK